MYHSASESVNKPTYKKYTRPPGIGVALEPTICDSANAATYKPVMYDV